VQQFHEGIADQRTAAAARRDGIGEFDLLHKEWDRGNGAKDYADAVIYLCK